MAQTMGVLILLMGSSLLNTAFAQTGNSTYTILAPKVLRPSSVYNVTATCFNVDSDVILRLRLQGADNQTVAETQAVLTDGIQQIVSLLIPPVLHDQTYVLVATGAGGMLFHDSGSVSVKRKTLSIFVQTDKPMYKPGQTVLFRAVVVYPNLKPYPGFMDIEIFDLAGNKIIQWLKQKNNTGVITQSLPLSDQTPLGDWKIVVKAEENSVEKTFQVAEYVLPKFEVKVMLPSFLLINMNRRDRQEDLTITVITKYTYGQPVKGRAKVTVQVQPYSMYDPTNYPKKSFDVQLTEGKVDLMLTSKDLADLVPTADLPPYYANDSMSWLRYRSILVVADVNETVTGKVLSGNSTVQCTPNKYTLAFSSFTPSNYKPGLTFTAYMELKKTDGTNPDMKDIKQSNGEYGKILVKATMNSRNQYDQYYGSSSYTYEQFNVTVDPSGFMSFSIQIKDNITTVNFEASFFVEVTNSTVNGNKYIQVFKSRDNQTIQVAFDSDDGIIKAQQQNTFDVSSNEPLATFQYAILSKGSVQLSGSVSGDPSTKHSFSVFVSKDLAMKLNPSARIVAWFVTEYGEVVADSVELTVGDGFGNEVSLSFDRTETTPSENVTLTVKADTGSTVFILALDQSVLLLKSGNDITENMITTDLKEYDSRPNNYYDPWFGPVDRRRKRSIRLWCPIFIGGEDTQTILSNAGVIMLTNAFVYKYKYNYRPYYASFDADDDDGLVLHSASSDDLVVQRGDSGPDGGPSKSPKPRVNFPETWLWTDAAIGYDGSASLRTSVPDTITSWIASAFAISPTAGIGVASEKAKLTVFKQFFLSPNLPYSIIRGEEFALQVTVFNYLSAQLKVKVFVEPSNYFTVKGESSVTTEVGSNDAASVYFWIIAGALGQIPIHIRGVSAVAGDSLIAKLLVKPEGVQRQYSTSVFIQLPTANPEFNTTLEVSLPPSGQLVPGSEYIEATAIGDIMGPSVKGLAALLQMPCGCGEQNMLNFAPDVFIYKYLSYSNQLTSDIGAQALSFMNAGYQRELTYQRTDGSFSAFGNQDSCGSIWLTAFVIKCFHQAKDYIPVDDSKIAISMKWMIEKQAPNGSFAEPPEGRVIHVDMQGGSSKGLSLAAYVLIALLENGNNSKVPADDFYDSVVAARNYLESQIEAVSSDPYALAILSYALVKANSKKVNEVLEKLETLAKVEAGTKHWEKASDKEDQSAEFRMWRPPYSQARAVNIEMSAYVLLTYCELKDLSMSLPIAKWIIAQRNANGGFSSTQDTVVALEALTAFAMLTSAPPGELSVAIKVSTNSVQHAFTPITPETSILYQSFQLPSDSKHVYVNARGRGSALVQLNAKYNVYKTEDISGIDLKVDTKQKGNKMIINSCSRWKKKEGSGMVVMEINQLTGFQASNVDDLMGQNDVIKRVETDAEKVVVYFDELPPIETCVNLVSEKVYAVSNVRDAPVKVYSYYDPSGQRVELYGAPQALGQNSACSECPQCCASSTNDKLPPSSAGKMFSAPNRSSLVVLTIFIVFIQSCFARIQ